MLDFVDFFDSPESCALWLGRVFASLDESELRCLTFASALVRYTNWLQLKKTKKLILDLGMYTLYARLAGDSSSPLSAKPMGPFVHQNASKKIYAVSHDAKHVDLLFCDVVLMTHGSPLLSQRDWRDPHGFFL